MPIQRATHVGICVTDLERSIEFYRDRLGFQYLSRIHVAGEPSDTLLSLRAVDLHAAYLERDGLRIELLYYASPKSPAADHPRPMNEVGFTHLSLRISDLDGLVSELRRRGVRVVDETKIDIPMVEAAAVMIQDPDGLTIELVQAPGDPAAPPQV